MTSELTDLLTLIQTIEWQAPTSKLDKAVAQALVKGSFGDPVKLLRGDIELKIPEPRSETELEKQKRQITNEQKYDPHELAVRLAEWLPDFKANFYQARFLHWQVAFPGIWTQWESVDLHGGFDAVIGNPPYVRQELIKEIKPALKRAYPETYSGAADLYVYFYEQGIKLLRPGGRMSYVVTNKWMRAGYAEGLRALFAEKAWTEFVADFGHAKKFFPDADVFPSVIVVRKPEAGDGPEETQVCAVSRDDVPEKDLEEFVANNTQPIPRKHFTKETWTLEPADVVSLLDKIRTERAPLSEFAGTKPFRGVLTGFNQAFLIDTTTRNQLIDQDPAAEQIIKPYLRGQDVKRWNSDWQGEWMIFARRGIISTAIRAFSNICRNIDRNWNHDLQDGNLLPMGKSGKGERKVRTSGMNSRSLSITGSILRNPSSFIRSFNFTPVTHLIRKEGTQTTRHLFYRQPIRGSWRFSTAHSFGGITGDTSRT